MRIGLPLLERRAKVDLIFDLKYSLSKAHFYLLFLLLTAFGAAAVDTTTAHLYKLDRGYWWSERNVRLSNEMEAEQSAIEHRYRIQSLVYHHDLKPNQATIGAWGGAQYAVHTNSLGFKDQLVRNVALVSPRHRILFLGDSFTEGLGLEYSSTFVGMIGEALSGKNREVLNAGVSSSSPIIYWRKTKYLLETVGLRFDEAVVFIDISDAQDEATAYDLDSYGNVIDRTVAPVIHQPLTFGFRLRSMVKEETVVSATLLKAIQNIRNREEVANDEEHMKYATGRDRALWTTEPRLWEQYGRFGVERERFYMDKLATLLSARHIPLTVAVYPWPDQIIQNDLDSKQVHIWQDWSREHGAKFINYFPDFISNGASMEGRKHVIEKFFIPHDVHWNREGHQLIANRFLETKLAHGHRLPVSLSTGGSDSAPVGPVRHPASPRVLIAWPAARNVVSRAQTRHAAQQ